MQGSEYNESQVDQATHRYLDGRAAVAMALTKFQRDGLEECESLLEKFPNMEHSGFQEVVGKRETYL